MDCHSLFYELVGRRLLFSRDVTVFVHCYTLSPRLRSSPPLFGLFLHPIAYPYSMQHCFVNLEVIQVEADEESKKMLCAIAQDGASLASVPMAMMMMRLMTIK